MIFATFMSFVPVRGPAFFSFPAFVTFWSIFGIE